MSAVCEIANDSDRYWLAKALRMTALSPDPATRVGAVIVRCGDLVSSGWNDLPAGIEPTPELLNNRDAKLEVMVHAEANAICSAARMGRATSGSTIYVVSTDDTGLVWGGCCVPCTTKIIQAGIRRVVRFPQKAQSKWKAEWAKADTLLAKTSIELTEMPA